MGLYLNPGNDAFRQALSDDIYIDKTKMIALMNNRLNKPSVKFVCVSRPRRFGKSMAANMLTAYYCRGCNSKELFFKYNIANEETFDEHLNQHDVIYINVQQFLRKIESLTELGKCIENAVLKEIYIAYSQILLEKQSNLPDALTTVYMHETRENKGFIFIIDEWDCIFRIAKNDIKAQKNYLDFLQDLFKDRLYVNLAYMTGILPIKKYGTHSAINIFDEHSMIDPKNLREYFGFTETEVRSRCEQHGLDYDDMARWYNGYMIGNLHIYNPKSVVDVLLWKKFKSYWTETETYEALKIYLDQNFDGLKEAVVKMLGHTRCKIDPSTFQNDMTTFKTRDDVLTLLVHLGYLTFDEKKSEVFIPNQEIAQEFMRAVKVGGWDGVIKALERSERLLHSTWNMDGNAVAQGIASIHNETSSILKYNNENALTCTILMAYYSAKAYYMNPIMELPSGKGYADVVYLPLRNVNRPALVIELKWNKSAIGAIAQIKEKQYASWIEGYTGDILLVGINYNEDKEHECAIEKYIKLSS
ncbi:AAA family ATPase [Sporofaciens musculi]|uniref:AAA family ATPase n=1 Tax=Sporofaciens musculi TaxID=2681861 RepID=UPI00256FAF99|nr:AAA family ATPase [Sporofaciens musculi]